MLSSPAARHLGLNTQVDAYFDPIAKSKASAFVQILTVAVRMARDAFPALAFNTAALAPIWPCVAATVWGGIHYTWRGAQFARTH